MKMIVKSLLIFACTVMGSFNANAQMTMAQYNEAKNKPITRAFLGGVGEGLMWANVEFEHKYRMRFYCPPSNLAMNMTNYLQILDDYVQKNPKFVEEVPLPLLLKEALEKTFPCKP